MANEEGYQKMAALMSRQTEFAVFRRFGKLNFLNILYLQAELTHLEAELRMLAERDRADPNRNTYSSHWWCMAHFEAEHHDRQQWEKMLQIRGKLKEYNEHLQQAVFLSGLKTAKSWDLDFLRLWLQRPKMGNLPILGPDQDSWSEEHDDDLLAIQRRESTDPFSRWKPIASDPASGIMQYAEAPVYTAINIFVTVLASLIPITSILILYFVSRTLDRLAIAVAFTGLFAFCLAATTRASRVEIFAATSAFAAVQVVFVTGNNGYIA